MTLFTKAQLKQLLENGNSYNRGKDHKPVVKLSLPGTALIILLSEIDYEETQYAYGLCDFGSGNIQLGLISLDELQQLSRQSTYPFEHDKTFKASQPLSVYTSAAQHFQSITCDENELEAQGSFFFSW